MHNKQRSTWTKPNAKQSKKEEEESWHDRCKRCRLFFLKYCCCCCSIAELLGILLGVLFGGIALATVLALYIKIPATTTIYSTKNTTMSTATTSTSVTTTTETTSSSSSTSSSTSSTSTSSASTSSTSSTSTSSTSTSTTSTSTTSTTTTSVTTVTTTTTATTVVITSNTCTSGWRGSTVLYHCDNCSDIAPYTQYIYTYTAISNRTRISFAFREDNGCFALDNVSVRSITAPAVELIANNDFETGTMSSWSYCNPSGATAAGDVLANSYYFQCMGYTYQAKSGSYFYYDGAVGACDYLFQMFSTAIGTTYNISYWLYNRGFGVDSSADVIISI